jgi:hypothetical protein
MRQGKWQPTSWWQLPQALPEARGEVLHLSTQCQVKVGADMRRTTAVVSCGVQLLQSMQHHAA